MTTKLQRSLQKMYETSYNTICQTENLSTNPLSHFLLYIENKNKYLYKSTYNNNANFIKMKTIERYLKFSLSINLATKEDKKEIRNKTFKKGIISLYERGELNRTTLEVYIDGVKLPDDVCYITIYDGSLDLYIPEKFVKNNVYMDIVTKKFSNNDKFSNIIIRNVIAHNIDFTMFNTSEINLDTIKIYKNGLLLTRKLDYEIINFLDVNKFTAIFNNKIIDSDIVEIQFDPNCIFYKYDIEKENSLITVPKDVLPNIPISPDICRFYINGKRLFNRDIEILSPRNFKIKNFTEKTKVLFFINYKNLYLDEDLVYHEDGIKGFNILSDEELVNIFDQGAVPDEGLEWITELVYPPRPININPNPNLLRDRTFEQFVDETVKEFLEDNAHNIVPFLTEYSNTYHFSYNFNINELQKRNSTKYDLGTIDIQIFKKPKLVAYIPKKYDSYYILAFADNIKIDEQYMYTRKFNNNIFIYIDADRLEGKQNLSLTIIPIYNNKHYRVKATITEFENQLFEFDRSSLGFIRTENDIIVMKKTEKGHSLQKKDIDYILTLGNKIEIEFINKNLLEEFVIYNSSFFNRKILDVKEEISVYKLNNEYPCYSNYTIEIYNNGKLLMEDVDFFISNQRNIEGLDEELIIFKNYPQKNDKLEIYHIEIPRIRFSSCKILNTDKYDLVYFRTDRNFGYGKEYIDLYINDVLVQPNNIKEIALNLISITQDDIPRPYKYITAKSKFSDDIFNIYDYIKYHQENPSKFAEYIDRLIRDSEYEKIEDIVSKVYPEIEIRDKNDEEETLIDRNLVDPLLEEISKKLYSGGLDRRLDANKYHTLFSQIEWLKFMDYIQRISPEIMLNANSKLLKKGLNISPSDTLIPLDKLTYIVAKEIRDNKFPYTINNIDMSEEEYYTHPISNKLYLEEVKFASCNINIPETIIIDANTNEEEYTLEDIVRLIDNRKIKKVMNLDYTDNQDLQFFFRINTSKMLIQEFEGLYINGLDYTDHANYNNDNNTLDILIELSSVDRVEIKYKRKAYSE